MTAIEFIREFGWEKSKEQINFFEEHKSIATTRAFIFRDQLKRLVDAWELVQSYGGLHGFKTYCNGDFSDQDLQAIALFEEVGND